MFLVRLAALMSLAVAPLAAVGQPFPIGFEENRGQFPGEVLYALRSGGTYLTRNSLELSPDRLSMQFEGANPATLVSSSDTLPYTVNVHSKAGEVRGIRRFGRVRYAGLYTGIDLEFSLETSFTFRFTIQPGADVAAIRLTYVGIVSPVPRSETQLILHLTSRRMGQNSTAYQETPGGRVAVGVHYKNLGGTRYGFALDSKVDTLPVIIETTLPISGYYLPSTRVVANDGRIYAMGTEPALMETCGVDPIEAPRACTDAVLYASSRDGVPNWISYLHGTSEDVATGIVADRNGSIYLAGFTASADFPTTANVFQRTYAGPPPVFRRYLAEYTWGDAFVAKFGTDGRVMYATYVGGPKDDVPSEIRVDAMGSVYIAGACSSDLPVTPGALQRTVCLKPGFPSSYAFGWVAKLDPTGRLAYLTYLPDSPSRFAVGREGSVYFGGTNGSAQVFVAKLNPLGSALTYSRTYAGNDAREVYSMDVDGEGSLWFAGLSRYDLGYRSYLAKLSPDGARLLYETPFIGGIVSTDEKGNLDVLTAGGGTVRTPGGVLTGACGDHTVSKLDPAGAVLLNRPVPNSSIGVSNGKLLSYTSDGLSVSAIQPAEKPDIACMLNAASLSIPERVAPGEIITIFGLGLGPASGATASLDERGRLPEIVAGVRVLFDGSPVPILYADSNQINAVAPYSLTARTQVNIVVDVNGRPTPPVRVTVVDAVPSLFTLDGSGGKHVLAFNQDGTLNSPMNPARLGSIVTLFATGMGVTSPSSMTGALAGSTDAKPVVVPTVILNGRIGGFVAEVLYAGPSPGSLTSVTQFNVRLPSSLAAAQWTYPMEEWPILFASNERQTTTISLAP